MQKLEHLTEEEQKAVSEIKERLVALVGKRLKGFYLFGSKARGDYDPGSDVDLAILVERLDPAMKLKIIDIVVNTEVKFLVVISPLVLSWADFLDLRDRERRIALDVESEGVLL